MASSDLEIEELISLINKNIGKEKSEAFLILDPKNIINKLHLLSAYANAITSFEDKTNRANRLNIEILIFVAMNMQINEALKVAAAKTNKSFLIFSNDKKIYEKLSKNFKNIREFKPTNEHIIETAKRFGISNTHDLEKAILQKITLSKLDFK